jgi:hypothetical protein
VRFRVGRVTAPKSVAVNVSLCNERLRLQRTGNETDYYRRKYARYPQLDGALEHNAPPVK